MYKLFVGVFYIFVKIPKFLKFSILIQKYIDNMYVICYDENIIKLRKEFKVSVTKSVTLNIKMVEA